MQNMSLAEARNTIIGYISGEIVPADEHEAEVVRRFASIVPDMSEFLIALANCKNTSCPFVATARDILDRIQNL